MTSTIALLRHAAVGPQLLGDQAQASGRALLAANATAASGRGMDAVLDHPDDLATPSSQRQADAASMTCLASPALRGLKPRSGSDWCRLPCVRDFGEGPLKPTRDALSTDSRAAPTVACLLEKQQPAAGERQATSLQGNRRCY